MSGVVQRYGVGTEAADDAFRERMESQCDRIEQYRLKVMGEDGRVLSMDEAALEWIEQYAASYDRVTDVSCG